jgi:hypothetical protein
MTFVRTATRPLAARGRQNRFAERVEEAATQFTYSKDLEGDHCFGEAGGKTYVDHVGLTALAHSGQYSIQWTTALTRHGLLSTVMW